MCGIAGVLDAGGIGRDIPETMATAIAHRGPDDATVHVEPGLGLGFRRLSIIDLEGGRQPIANENGSILVVLNGEIYNYRELRRRLEKAGHRFSTESDTEVLVHLYEERGADLVDELRGMFAFAIWDRPRRRLMLARDHLGQKPLFWARSGTRLYFASEIKSILAVAPEFRVPDPLGLHEYLTLRVISEPRTMFRGIHKLPAGNVMVVEGEGDPVVRRYWSLTYEPKQSFTEDEAVSRLDDEVREAVRLHLVADVEVGAFLSGGVDSGLVTALVRDVTGLPFKTFSMGTRYGAFDETPAARAVASRYGTEHFEDWVDGDLAQLLPTLVHYLDEPSDPLSACVWQIAALASRHVKVVLGGDGGDELFGGYDRYYGTRYARYWSLLPAPIRSGVIGRILDWAPDGRWYKSLGNQLRWLNELAALPADRRYGRSLSYFYFAPRRRDALYTDAFRRTVEHFEPEESIRFWQRDESAKEALDAMLLADSMVRLPNHSVMILDRMTMAHGLEARSPFLDHRLAEFCATLPVRLKVRGRRRRIVEMRLGERYLPPEVMRRPKQGFSSALPYMMDKQFRTLFGAFLNRAHLVEAGYLQANTIRSMVSEHLARRADHGNRLWLLLNAELWYRMKVEGDGSDQVAAVMRESAERAGEPSPESRVKPSTVSAQRT